MLLGEVVFRLAALVAHLRGQIALCRHAAAVVGGRVTAAAAEAQDGLAAGVVAREEDEGCVLGRGL